MEAAPDQDLVIVGATGDLARRKLLPAIYDLAATGLLPSRGRIVGMGRREVPQEYFLRIVRDAMAEGSRTGFNAEIWRRLEPRLSYAQTTDEGLSSLKDSGPGRRLIYLAVPPDAFSDISGSISRHGLAQNAAIVVEKPFGHDLETGRRLNQELHAAFDESQVYRIDHYLGKETVQNLLVFRFGNAVFERVWNRDAVEHIQVTVAESIGIEGRGAFYDSVGATRDVLQNHMLQMLAMLMMEPPTSFRGESVRDEKSKLLRAIRPLRPGDVVRGQYTAGYVGGEYVRGYREEDGVDKASDTETFVAARLRVDNWRWSGVPVFLRTGKRLPQRRTQIDIEFRVAPMCYFEDTGPCDLTGNRLSITIQPEEAISFTFLAKVPGTEIEVQPAQMSFSYDDSHLPDAAEAYERLVYDALRGDHTLFVREDAIERAWEIVQPVLDQPPPLHSYPAGTWGPQAANRLVHPHAWNLGGDT